MRALSPSWQYAATSGLGLVWYDQNDCISRRCRVPNCGCSSESGRSGDNGQGMMTFSILSRPLTAGIGRCALGLTPAMRRFLVMALGQFMLVISGSAHAALPAPLSDFDVAQYIRLFDLQQQGNMKQATREMGRLENPRVKGLLLSQRELHPTAWRSS